MKLLTHVTCSAALVDHRDVFPNSVLRIFQMQYIMEIKAHFFILTKYFNELWTIIFNPLQVPICVL